jgi:hypothetical protein
MRSRDASDCVLLWEAFYEEGVHGLWFHGVWTCGAKVFESYILKQQCLSVWVVFGRFFQSLPVPCGDKQDKARCHFY